ncbi:helix-turn-helix domain-containing protein [Nitrosomonas sp.]|uniref:helix-turn-helix domain-containing protein n=1 Tax=Nitrosomonas sp. TaxID=42353 RepID=UPI0025E5CD14|nr:helix-turn-helix domain-containing protein [Nitrosomonas sp.]
MNSEPWVTAVDVARHLGVVKDTVYRWRERKGLPAQRHAVYEAARACHPQRWSGKTRNWNPVETVYLNPEKTSPTSRTAASVFRWVA